VTKAISEDERARRRQYTIDSRAAVGLGLSLEQCLTARKAAIESWTTLIRAQMQEHNAGDPVEVLPQLLARLQETVVGEARTAARAAAREEVQRLLRKAIA
jgi:hypothetical protein